MEMSLHRLIATYGFGGLIKLASNWFKTKIFYQEARLIRLPIFIRGRNSISWGRGFTTGVGVRLDAFGGSNVKLLTIGERVQINDYVHISAIEHVYIGNDVLIASRVFITDHNHGRYDQKDEKSTPDTPPSERPLVSAPVIIEDRVWLGESVSVMPGVKIGQGSIVGAGAVVTHDLPPDSISIGIPARVIKRYDREKKEWLTV